MTFLEKQIIEKINEYDKIALFFHEIPDFDTLGSCFALKLYLTDKFPKKQVEIIGFDTLNEKFSKDFFVFEHNHIPHSFLENSLGIILDTANSTRVWSRRHTYCKELIRIDHHPMVESFCDIEFIDEKASSTCELVGMLLFDWDETYISALVASYLYAGILTDTGRFLYMSTRPETFNLTAKLISRDFNRDIIHNAIYLKSFKQSRFESYVVSKIKMHKDLKFGYVVIPHNAFDKFNIDLRFSMVHVFNNINELEVWMSIYYDNTINKWRGSLRSRYLQINDIAKKYNGGGHIHAAGFTLEHKSDYKRLINDLVKYIKQHQKEESGKDE